MVNGIAALFNSPQLHHRRGCEPPRWTGLRPVPLAIIERGGMSRQWPLPDQTATLQL